MSSVCVCGGGGGGVGVGRGDEALSNNVHMFFCDVTRLLFCRHLLGERSEPHTGVFNRDFA